MRIQTILAPVDCSPLSERVVGLAVEVAEAFGARLLLLHNLEDAPPGLGATWMHRSVMHESAERRGGDDAEVAVLPRLQELLAMAPESVPVEARLTRGLVVPSVLQLIAELSVDLVVLGTHDRDPEEHASMAEALLARCPCPVLTPAAAEATSLRPEAGRRRRLLAATDFSPGGDHAVGYAGELARALELDLDLLHVLPSRAAASRSPDGPGAAPALDEDSRRAAAERLAERVPEDLASRVRCHVRSGDPAATIAACAAEHAAAAIVAGGHARSLWRSLLTADTARLLLHRRPAAVWFVPEPTAP